jgi:hypothetical protein
MGIIVIISVSLILGSVLVWSASIVALQKRRMLLPGPINLIIGLNLIVYFWKRAYQNNLTYAVY